MLIPFFACIVCVVFVCIVSLFVLYLFVLFVCLYCIVVLFVLLANQDIKYVKCRAVREDEISVKKSENVTILSSNLSRGYLVHRPTTSQVPSQILSPQSKSTMW